MRNPARLAVEIDGDKITVSFPKTGEQVTNQIGHGLDTFLVRVDDNDNRSDAHLFQKRYRYAIGPALDDASVTAVPLPAALPLFASGLVGLGWLSRRRRKRADHA
jgi:hypothetical protein